MKSLTICAYGASCEPIDPIYIYMTEELGKALARRGHRLVYGGGSSGLMGAISRGVADEGGQVIGVVPSFMSGFSNLNKHLSRMIWAETMAERKEIMEREGQAFIVLPGGVGTMDEFFQILTLAVLDQKSAPIILYNINGYYDSLLHFIDQAAKDGFIPAHSKDLFRVFHKPEEALDFIEYFAATQNPTAF